MPEYDWDKVEEAQGYSPLPDGKYYCVVEKADLGTTANGDEMFKLEFKVLEGAFKGRKLFDNIIFSERALGRAKLMLKRMGLELNGKVNVKWSDVQGRKVIVVCDGTEDYTTKDGETRTKNLIPFDGYERVPDDGHTPLNEKDDDGDPLPF